jgi:membrane protease YdiL (CAAX protease family)
MKALLVRRPVESFFVIAFLFSWIAVLPVVLNPALPPEPFQILGSLLGPTLSAFLVIGITEGRNSLGYFIRRYAQWRAGILWWLVVLFGALVSVNLIATLIVGSVVLKEFGAHIGIALATYFLTLVTGIILGPLWEEPGWRGFALPRLQSRHGPLVGTLILGVLWAVWHLPGYFGGWLLGSPLALLVSSVAFSIIMTWVYNNTRGSILLMILLHSSSNATLSLGALVLPTSMPQTVERLVNNGWIPAITYSIAALLVILATRGLLSFKRG